MAPGNSMHTSILLARRRLWSWFLIVVTCLLLAACAELNPPPLPTPLPSDYISTAVALTLEAAGDSPQGSLPVRASASQGGTPTPKGKSATPSATLPPTETPEPSPTVPSPTPYTLPPSPTPTPTPETPNAEIEIRNLGPLSRVRSPLHVYLYLKPGAGGKVRIELMGEDGRLIYREIRVIDLVPVGAWATITLDIDYEIAVAAEAGRLKISVDDAAGRTVALNSLPLILLSVGDADIVPPADVLAPLIIRQPRKKALIQGGTLVASGRARLEGDGPLMVKLVTATGGEVGFRLADVVFQDGDSYGEFAVEVPYKVSEPTPALLVILEPGASLSDVIHLSSIEVLLSP